MDLLSRKHFKDFIVIRLVLIAIIHFSVMIYPLVLLP